MEKLLSIGKILNFHGLMGEVKVGYSDGIEKILSKPEKLFAEKHPKLIELTPIKARFVKSGGKRTAIVKFAEINSIEEAAEIKGAYLKLQKSKLDEMLEEDEFYIDDLVGLNVFDEAQNLIGKVSAVSLAATNASNSLEIASGKSSGKAYGKASVKGHDFIFMKDKNNREHIIPFTKGVVPVVDIENKKLVIANIEGLLGGF